MTTPLAGAASARMTMEITYTNNSATDAESIELRLAPDQVCSICGRKPAGKEKVVVGPRGILCVLCIGSALHLLADAGENLDGG